MEKVFTVRPFKRVIAREASEPLVLSGSIERGSYVFRIGEVPFELRTTEIGMDENGPFAKVRDADRPSYGGWVLTVEVEHDEPVGDMVLSGCCIRYYKPGDRAFFEEVARREGYDPEKFEVIEPVDHPGWSVHFTGLGKANGFGWPGREGGSAE